MAERRSPRTLSIGTSRQGFDPVAWGENLAGRMTTEEDALQQLENAPAHDAMMNATTVEAFGLGVSGPSRDTRWVLVMATEH